MTPTPDQIKQARQDAGLTQTEAGALIHAKLRTWQDWEGGQRNMPPAKWEFFLSKASALQSAPVSTPTERNV